MRRPSNRVVIADDATGALEAGALLAESGFRTVVELDSRRMTGEDAQARTILLPTRHVEPELAGGMVRTALCAERWPPGTALYWKTDSTLRGPIGACFEALLDVFPGTQIVYLPAYPALARTVRKGLLYVHGIPVTQTAFARDPRNPVRTAVVREAIATGFEHAIHHSEDAQQLKSHLDAGPAGVIICDAETEEDLAVLFRVCHEHARPLILAGPAGGIRHWIKGCSAGRVARTRWPAVHHWSVLCGSLHPVSRIQANAAARLGLDVRCTPDEEVDAGEDQVDSLAIHATRCASEGIMIFGGDTALAVWRALGITTLVPLGEVLPGVAVSQSRGRVFVTKAGGYGEPDLAAKVLERWNS